MSFRKRDYWFTHIDNTVLALISYTAVITTSSVSFFSLFCFEYVQYSCTPWCESCFLQLLSLSPPHTHSKWCHWVNDTLVCPSKSIIALACGLRWRNWPLLSVHMCLCESHVHKQDITMSKRKQVVRVWSLSPHSTYSLGLTFILKEEEEDRGDGSETKWTMQPHHNHPNDIWQPAKRKERRKGQQNLNYTINSADLPKKYVQSFWVQVWN